MSVKNSPLVMHYTAIFLILAFCQYHDTRVQCQQIDTVALLSPEDCGPNQYFDISHLSCEPCPENSVKSLDGTTCTCTESAKTISNYGFPGDVQCSPCPNGQTATSDGWGCIPCKGECPPTCPANQIRAYRTLLGKVDQELICQKCLNNTEPDTTRTGQTYCAVCNPKTQGANCVCSAPKTFTGGICFEPSQLIPDSGSLYSITYPDEGGTMESSWYFRENLRAAEAMCRLHNNLTACQALANFCTLLHYTQGGQGSEDACTLYVKLTSQTGQAISWPKYMPWLYYWMDPRTTLDEVEITTEFAFAKNYPNSKLKIWAATYSTSGHYLGLEKVSGILPYCPADQWLLESAFQFGQSYSQKCQLTINQLIDLGTYPRFYDLWLEFKEGDTATLYPIPLLNKNYEKGSRKVNQLTSDEEKQSWQLTRRLFLVDAVSARRNQESLPQVIQYASKITMEIELQKTRPGRIYPPLIKIIYSSVKIAQSDQANENGQKAQLSEKQANQLLDVTFNVNYKMSTVKREKDLEIAMGCICTLGAIWAALRTWSWAKRSGQVTVDFLTILKFLLYLAGSLSNIFFVAMLSMSLWLLVFYKKQKTAFLMFPSPDQEYSFLVYIGLATALKSIELAHLLFEQLLTEIFFVDWERPRGQVIPLNGEPQEGVPTKPPSPITIWRTYLVANEFNELLVQRKTSVVLQVLSMIFFLKILHFESLAVLEPGSSLHTMRDEFPDTRMSRFAVSAALYLGIGFIQWFVSVIIIERAITDQFHSFGDLCSISNISVFILRYKLYGYYIHGRSVHGYGDTNMREMNEMLQRERENLCAQRGLEPNTDNQVFIMCLPPRFRTHYDRIVSLLNSPANTNTHMGGTADQITIKIESMIQVYEQLNAYLFAFLDHCVADADYKVADRSFLEAVLDIEFQDSSEQGIFFKDKFDQAFTGVVFYGNEYTLLTFDLLIFCITDLIAHNYLVAAIVTWLFSLLVSFLRQRLGTKRLMNTSMVDDRFLI